MPISKDQIEDYVDKVIVVQQPTPIVYGIWIYEIDGWFSHDDIVFHTPYQEVAAAQLRRLKQNSECVCTHEVREIAISGVARGATKILKRK